MPERNARSLLHTADGAVPLIHEPALMPDRGSSSEPPDQAPCQDPDERMVQIARLNIGVRPGALLPEELLQPAALGSQQLVGVLGGALQRAQLLAMGRLYRRGSRAFLLVAAQPGEFQPAVFIHFQKSGELSERAAQQTNFGQAAGR